MTKPQFNVRFFQYLSTEVLLVLVALAAAPPIRAEGQAAPPSQQPATQQQQTDQNASQAGGPSGDTGVIVVPKKKENPDATPPPPAPAAPKFKNPEGAGNITFHVNVPEVTIDVGVMVEKTHQFVPGLRPSNFRVYEDGVEQKVEGFKRTEAPITALILMEYAARGYIFRVQALNAAWAFAEQLRPQDYVAMMTFDLNTHIVSDFTQDKKQIQEGIDVLANGVYMPAAFRETDVFDALNESLDRLSRIEGQKYIILIATGIDTLSKLTSAIRRTEPVGAQHCQRVGPSTGQPTRHEQSDLSHLANLGHGEYPRFILAPADPVDCFDLTIEALNLAERWRLPVILLLDQALSQNTATSPRFDLSKVRVDRGKRLTPETAAKLAQYKVYEFASDGVSPYTAPGTPGIWAEVTGNEHDEWGHVSVNPANRLKMMKKRMEKLVHARSELPPCRLFGPPTAKIGLIGFGSTSGPILEAQRLLEHRGVATRYLQARTVFPVPVHEIDPFLKEVDVAYVVEHNYTGQLARLLRETMPWHHAKLRSILKYDGLTFRAPQIVAEVKGVA